jgi:NAD(P)H-hydrate repair Nnr-like enzyme with NAD(P)H-hydrate epimerase domain
MAVDRRKLQQMIDKTVAAQNTYHVAQAKLNEWCQATYGFEPGDVDADEIIDAVFGGAGVSGGMKAADFDAIMEAAKA